MREEVGVLGYEKKRFDDAPTALPTAAEMLVARAMSRRGSQTVQLDAKSTVSRKTRAASLCLSGKVPKYMGYDSVRRLGQARRTAQK